MRHYIWNKNQQEKCFAGELFFLSFMKCSLVQYVTDFEYFIKYLNICDLQNHKNSFNIKGTKYYSSTKIPERLGYLNYFLFQHLGSYANVIQSQNHLPNIYQNETKITT